MLVWVLGSCWYGFSVMDGGATWQFYLDCQKSIPWIINGCKCWDWLDLAQPLFKINCSIKHITISIITVVSDHLNIGHYSSSPKIFQLISYLCGKMDACILLCPGPITWRQWLRGCMELVQICQWLACTDSKQQGGCNW